MKKTISTASAALTLGLFSIGSAPAWGQAAPAPAPAAPAAAPAADAAAAPAPTSPVSMPSMSATIASNVKPLKLDTPVGDVYVTGAISALGLWQGNPITPYDKRTQADISNGQVVIQKIDGPIQFYVEAGAYSFPTVGVPYTRAGQTTSATFGPMPVGFVKWAATDSISIQAGHLPTLIGAEYAFTFQNVNIERGLLWNQENIVSRGVQLNYSQGAISASVAITDGYFSNRYSWLTGLVTWTIDPSNSVTFDAGGSLSTETYSSSATPLLQNNSSMYNVYASHTSGAWTFSPTLQYTSVAADAKLGTTKDLHTWGGGMYVVYAMDGGINLAGRAEYISSNGDITDGAGLLGYGGGSKAWSLTFTPTWQNKFLFVRGELSYTKVTNSAPGLAFGSTGNSTNQARAMVETGIVF
jgi:hypothetical protein